MINNYLPEAHPGASEGNRKDDSEAKLVFPLPLTFNSSTFLQRAEVASSKTQRLMWSIESTEILLLQIGVCPDGRSQRQDKVLEELGGGCCSVSKAAEHYELDKFIF